MSDTVQLFEATPDNPAPDGIMAGLLPAGTQSLRFAIVPARGPAPPRGTILLLQGRNEAAEKYFETMVDLSARGFTVATFDWRGQGRSGRLAGWRRVGHVRGMKVFADDLALFVNEVLRVQCPPPYAALAHSMGGTVALAAMDRIEPAMERLVCLGPLVGFPGPPGAIRSFSALAALLHWTGLGTLPLRQARTAGRGTTLADNSLTSDPRRFARNRQMVETTPDLFVRALSASWLHAMARAMRRLDRSDAIARMRLPTLIVTAGADRVVSSRAAARLAWRMRCGHHLAVPGARHELLQEADAFREPVLDAIETFFASALPRLPETAQAEALPPIDFSPIEKAAAGIAG